MSYTVECENVQRCKYILYILLFCQIIALTAPPIPKLHSVPLLLKQVHFPTVE